MWPKKQSSLDGMEKNKEKLFSYMHEKSSD